MALPKWLDDVPNIDFSREKDALNDIVAWGNDQGWQQIATEGLEFSARQRTDLALQKGEHKLRFAVQPKSRSNLGLIRIQAIPTFREAIIVWDSKHRAWHLELGDVPLDKDWDATTFEWLTARLFAG